ncbi:WXG100 family type VII secretion target [Actinomadura barringtoniae]|nr:WXG100 family type VII secretion target [Actinomadura barringtoniae]
MGAFSTEYTAMQQAEQLFQSKQREMSQRLDELEGDLQSGLSKWEDDARDAYFNAKKKWDKAARELAKCIETFSKNVSGARQNYQKAEQANTQLWA